METLTKNKDMEGINKDTPIALMTLGQLQKALGFNQKEKEEKQQEVTNGRRYVYGLKGIRDLFGGISAVTARKYKDTIIADAVSQQGRIIVTDAEKAMRLFNEHTKNRKQ